MLDIIARARITKVDARQRLVYGRATQEVVDKSGEIFDYGRSKPHFQKWSGDIAAATKAAGQEESLGNVRAMHKDIVAGKLTEIVFDDAEKAIDVCAHIDDEAQWERVANGVYTGFSIGGKYADRWPDAENPKLKRFEAIPAEISLVDNPCVPTATFEMIKADGGTELRKFVSTPPDETERTTERPAGDAPAGDAAKAAVPAALAEGQTAPASSPAPALQAPAVEPPAAARVLTLVTKGMYDVAQLACVLDTIRCLASSAKWEADIEQDASPLPAQLREWLASGAKILVAMSDEEAQELLASLDPEGAAVMAYAAKAPMAKASDAAGATITDPAQLIHDQSLSMGARCGSGGPDKAAPVLDLTKSEPYVKLAAERDDLAQKLATATTRVTELEATPLAPKGVVKAVPVEKTGDTAGTGTEAPTSIAAAQKTNNPLEIIKAVHAAGGLRLA
jgi:hypothetical protein